MNTESTSSSAYRIGIDVGGTFTDIVVGDLLTGDLLNFKEPSTPEDPSLGVISGLKAVFAEYGIQPDTIKSVVHGTTIGLNALLQRRGAKLGLIVSQGNRDILEIARGYMPNPYDMYAQKDIPLVPRERVFECSARGLADRTISTFPNNDELTQLCDRLSNTGVESVVINLLHAYANPDPEHRLLEVLSKRLPNIQFTASFDVWPEIREYERCLVACMNAFIGPLKRRYFERLEYGLQDLGIVCPIYISTSSGGCVSLHTARERPIDTVLSGPASGVVAAANLAKNLKNKNIVTVDMGGTSTDMSVCEEGLPQTTTSTHVGDFPLVLPVVGVSAIGAGGGSVLWQDDAGLLKVGPESAGANPGPVCFGKGGTKPTLTDCYVVLGYIDADRFLGGRMPLNRNAASKALEELGRAFGYHGEHIAQRVASAGLKIATAKMASELLKGLASFGADPREYTMVPFGGAGPTNATFLAEEAHIGRLVVPGSPGLFCALGALMSDLRRDFVRSMFGVISDGMEKEIGRIFLALDKEAGDWLESEGISDKDAEKIFSLDLRYSGQAHYIDVLLPKVEAHKGNIELIVATFHREHERLYGFSDELAAIDIKNLRIIAVGKMAKPPTVNMQPALAAPTSRIRSCYLDENWVETTIYNRAELPANVSIYGPVILEQSDTTIVVPMDWRVEVDSFGQLNIVKGTDNDL
ncbi:MAG: hydantoinase/oxoprolinase family protein [Methyloligellaceae bacterium]